MAMMPDFDPGPAIRELAQKLKAEYFARHPELRELLKAQPKLERIDAEIKSFTDAKGEAAALRREGIPPGLNVDPADLDGYEPPKDK